MESLKKNSLGVMGMVISTLAVIVSYFALSHKVSNSSVSIAPAQNGERIVAEFDKIPTTGFVVFFIVFAILFIISAILTFSNESQSFMFDVLAGLVSSILLLFFAILTFVNLGGLQADQPTGFNHYVTLASETLTRDTDSINYSIDVDDSRVFIEEQGASIVELDYLTMAQDDKVRVYFTIVKD